VFSGVKPSQIGIITPYNGQLEVLRELMFPTVGENAAEVVSSSSGAGLKKVTKPRVVNPLQVDNATISATGRNDADVSLEGLEIKTIDGFQGGEKECILLSLVRSNASHTVGFLGERRRINVAVTRAKRHLAVFCDADTCSVDKFMGTLIEHMGEFGDHIGAQEFLDFSLSEAGFSSSGGGSGVRHSSNHEASIGTGAVQGQGQQKTLEKEREKLVLERSDFVAVLTDLAQKASETNAAAPTAGGGGSSVVVSVSTASRKFIPVSAASADDIDKKEITGGTMSVTPGQQQQKHQEVKAKFYSSTGVLRFPSSMNAYLRMLVHEAAEELRLPHRSQGDGPSRCIEVLLTGAAGAAGSAGAGAETGARIGIESAGSAAGAAAASAKAGGGDGKKGEGQWGRFASFAALDAALAAVVVASAAEKEKEVTSAATTAAALPPAPLVPSTATVVAPASVPPANAGTSAGVGSVGVQEMGDSNSSEDSDAEEPTTSTAVSVKPKKKKSKPKGKKPAAQKLQEQQVYVSAARVSAVGRLELQRELELKAAQQNDADDDAIMAAAIAHNQVCVISCY
jgi:hypothetical protein